MARHSTRRPLIGITAGTTRMMSGAWAGHDAVTLTEHYVRALREAGARVVILSPQDLWTEDELAELDGLVLSGGRDLDPSLYGAVPRETDLTPDPERDAFEAGLYALARRAGVPVLGICRGLQIIAAAEGGTLHQHLPEDVEAYPTTGLEPTEVDVELSAASDLALALGTRARVTAYHHQAVREVPPALRAVGSHAASGVVLALEAVAGSPVLAVQWHPELGEAGAGLFDHFVATARAASAAGTVRAGVR